MFREDDLLPISALQHLAFCERQWGLIYLERLWAENRLTVEGSRLHERAHEGGSASRAGVRVVRGMPVRSLRLGLFGVADVVEFHPVGGASAGLDFLDEASGDAPDASPEEALGEMGEMGEMGEPKAAPLTLAGVSGQWLAVPVEYKRGRPKSGSWDEVQLCAQALCLEEMLAGEVAEGFLFYRKDAPPPARALSLGVKGRDRTPLRTFALPPGARPDPGCAV